VTNTGWQLEVVSPNGDSSTFEALRGALSGAKHCPYAPTRVSKDYEWEMQTSERWLKVAMIRLMLRRLGRN
jgi:hypothetical protein